MNLNPGQLSAISRIVEKVSAPNTAGEIPGITLIGEGGTGKTTCIMQAVDQLIQQGFTVLLTAPTNKAVKQLIKSAREYGLPLSSVGFSTIHGALGLAMMPNEDRKSTFRATEGILGNYDVVVVDEGSMLGRYVLEGYLIPELQFLGIKVILMGDDMQLPPIKETVSPCFTLFETLRLTKVERFDANSGIGDLVRGIRSAISEERPFKAPDEFGPGVEAVLPAHFIPLLKEHFVPGVDLDTHRVLAWSNRRVDELNRKIRENIYGKNPDRFYPGERVVTGGPVKRGDVTLLGTDEECEVVQYRVSTIEEQSTGLEFTAYQLILQPLHTEDNKRVMVNILHEDAEDDFEVELERRARVARNAPREHVGRAWGAFWNLKNLVSDIRYCYCITVHRSQGSTFDHTFVDIKDILRNKIRSERQRLLCVACSRPRHKLYLNKQGFIG